MANDQVTNEEFYPLALEPQAREMVWGGRNLERILGKALPPEKKIGETWEAWDGCVIQNGTYRGITLDELIARDADAILGTQTTNPRFPLLFKFIDAQEDLSVQVHPDDDQAHTMEHQLFGKTEAWYVIHAEPGAQLIHGFKNNVNAGQVNEYLQRNDLQALLDSITVQSGDVIFVPAGTVHAIGKGIVLAEIQENSDITYRLYDWGRQGRQLHIAQSLQVAEFTHLPQHTIPRLTIHHATFDQHFLVACQYFAFELFDIHQATTDLQLDNRFNILAVIAGSARITFGANGAASVEARLGQSLILPAGMQQFGIVPQATPCKILRAYVPDLQKHIVEPLKRAGYSSSRITPLGGVLPKHNDLLLLI